MSAPSRIQLRRSKGWRMPANTVKVTRPGKWGNPFVVTDSYPPGYEFKGAAWGLFAVPSVEEAVACFREMLSQPGEASEAMRGALPELRGKNLACWCPIGSLCHADVLLDLANRAITCEAA